ncbi:hypothetical protein ACFL27_16825 [candidate division CSSED10-310 bacterium]|uniref:LysM domain-containing protein n=1 Tax=candidate division CSSED10-310 bacterium TaxID=2855610 RepID=A0ABV6Z084_UNCC1
MMESTTSCPVCGLENSTSRHTQCPFCQTERTQDRNPELLIIEPDNGSRKIYTLFAAVLALALLVVIILMISLWHNTRLTRLESRVLDQKLSNQENILSLDTRLEQLAENQMHMLQNTMNLAEVVFMNRLQKKKGLVTKEHGRNSLHKPVISESSLTYKQFWTYDADDKDTLWGLAQKFYGSGKYYPVLLEHNPHLGIFDVGGGDRLKVLNNKDLAPQIYKTVVEKDGPALYWSYPIQEGDTRQSIAEKFYKSAAMAYRIRQLNPGASIQPGEKIKIQLE